MEPTAIQPSPFAYTLEAFDIVGERDAYCESDIVNRLIENRNAGKPLTIAFCDIDSTLTSTAEEQLALRAEFAKNGIVLCFISSRTEEMMMSAQSYAKSPEVSNKRQKPKLKTVIDGGHGIIDHLRDNARHFEEAFADDVLHNFAGLYDSDMIISQTGANLLVRQPDSSYIYDNFQPTKDGWRETVLESLNNSGLKFELSKVDTSDNFDNGKIDVAPTERRIQLNFDSFEDQSNFISTINSYDQYERQFDILEDGHPENGRFQVYLTPPGVNKMTAADHALNRIMEAVNSKIDDKITKSDITLFIAGDSAPDAVLSQMAPEASSVFVLAKGSRLAKKTEEGWKFNESIGAESLGMFAGLAAMPDMPGVYFNPFNPKRRVVIAEEFAGNQNISNCKSVELAIQLLNTF